MLNVPVRAKLTSVSGKIERPVRNGSLADIIFCSAERNPYWNQRVRIALDVAKGILYLHDECEPPILHCDINPQNILMDEFWTAKISDFGLAKLLVPDQMRTLSLIRGTRVTWRRNVTRELQYQ